MADLATTAINPAENLRVRLAERGIELRGEIGQGATAVVYQAYDRRHGRLLAVKVLSARASVLLGADRFLREIQVAAGLQHPHIIPIYDSGCIDGTPFYVMPYINGESLRERLSRSGALPIEQALQIAGQIGDALAYAHAHGVVHRDIKPENILLEGDNAVLVDFGIALSTTPGTGKTDGQDDAGRLTHAGMVIGTPAYMSPEQASPDGLVDSRSDIFSLGCVVYEMLAGEPPFRGRSARAVIARRFQEQPTKLHLRRPDLPPGISAAVEKALAVDPGARFARIEDFVAALQGHHSTARRSRLRFRSRVALLGGSAIAAMVLLGGRLVGRPVSTLDPRRVAIAALSNETGENGLAPLGALVTSWITDRLDRAGVVEVVTSATVVPAQHDSRVTGQAWDGPQQLHGLATETHAGTLVSGSYFQGPKGSVEFHLEITDANSGRLLDAIGPVDSRGSSEAIADQLSRAVTQAVDSVVGQTSRDQS